MIAFGAPWAAIADDLLVANSTGTNATVPIYGTFTDDNYQHTQTIYPASMLTQMQGGSITKLTYYLQSAGTDAWGATFEVRLGTTTQSSFSSGTVSYISMTGSANYTGVINNTNSNALIEITLSTPYTYNSGNLVVDFRLTGLGSSYQGKSFYGESGSTYYSIQSRSTSSVPNSTGSGVSFMPKTQFTYTTTTTLTVNVNNNTGGTVTGSNNSCDPNYSYLITATPNSGYRFLYWKENNTVVNSNAITYVNMSSNHTYTAYFEPIYTNTATASPTAGGTVAFGTYTYDFDDSTTQGWTNIDSDGDHIVWDVFSNTVAYNESRYDDLSGTGNGYNSSTDCLVSGSWSVFGSKTPDNYLVSPKVQLGGSISFWARNIIDDYGNEIIGVAVSTVGNTSASDFTTISNYELSGTAWTKYTVSLSDYSGEGYVAIRNFDTEDVYMVMVDDITIVPGSGTTVTGTFNSGQSGSLTATANSGYNFSRWDKNGSQVSTSNPYTFTASSSDAYTAVFTVPITTMTCGETYSATLGTSGVWNTYPNSECGWSETGEEKSYVFTPSTTGRYTFSGENTSGDTDFFILTSNSNTAQGVGCWSSGDKEVDLTGGTTYYVIADNYTGSSSVSYSLSVSCTVKHALTYSVSNGSILVTNNGNSVSSGSYVAEGTVLNITASPNSGYSFSEWTVSGTGATLGSSTTASTTLTMGTGDVTLTASFVNAQSIPYTETFESNTWTEVNGLATNLWYRGSLGAHDSSYGYYISNNSGTSNAYSTGSISVVYIYKNVYFPEAGTYSLSFDLRQNGETTWDCVGAMLYANSDTPSASTTSAGSGLTSWPSGYSVMIGGAGAALSGGNWVRPSFTFNVSSAGIYKLTLAWKNDSNGGTQPPASIDNVYLTKTSPLTITANPSGGGSVSVTQNGTAVSSGASVGQGETLNITATPASGYKFNGWTVTGSGASVANANSASTTFTMGSEAATLTANFVEWAVNIATSPASTECLTSGTQVTMTASHDIPIEYSFTVASGTYSAISGTSSVSGDDEYAEVSLGENFTFNYWGKDYTTATISTNGFLKLGSGSDGYGNNLASTSYYNYLAAFWDDLQGNSTQYTTTGTAPNRVFIMQFNGYRRSDNTSNTFTFQIKLYETTNVIEFWYGDGFPSVAYSSTTASIGINNRVNGVTSFISVTPTGDGTATTSTSTSNNSIGTTQCDYLTSGTIYRFTPPAITYAWSYTGTAGTANNNVYTASPTTNSSYTINVTYNGATKSETVDVTLIPAAPTNLQSSNVTAISATVSWNANGASSWKYSIDGGTNWTPTSTASADLSGLSPGNTYTFQVKAVNGSCESSAASVSFTTLSNYIITTAASPAAGGSVSGGGSYAPGSTVTLTATPTSNWIFYKWSDGTNTYTANPLTFTASATATYTAYFAPLKINDETDWGYFADAVNNGFNYSGQTVTMTADVGPVSTMAGTTANRFSGTFDGGCNTLTFNKEINSSNNQYQHTAPFRYISSATIQNLRVAGTVKTASKFGGGVVAHAQGTGNIITNCINSTVIDATIASNDFNGSHGGILGQLAGGSNYVTISGCVFNGKMLGSGVQYWCGILGYTSSSTYSIVDCLFDPEEVSVGGNSHTIYRDGGHVSNCYYTTLMGTATQNSDLAYTITAGTNTTVALTGTTDHDYAASCSGKGLTFYDNEDDGSTFDNGFSFNNGSTTTLYAAGNVTANLLLGATTPANNTFFYYEASDGGTLSGTATTGTDDAYTLTMPASNVVVSAHFVDQMASDNWTSAVDALSDVPTGGITVSSGNVSIGNKEGLAWVISMVNGLNGVTDEDAQDYGGLTYTLTADVDMSAYTWVPIGTTEHPFSGTFNGNGHVITGITRSTDFPHNGLFGYVNGNANIQNVVVQASLTGNSHATGAVVGTFASTGTISNVEGAGTLTGGTLTTALGGIAGNKTSGTLHSSFAVATLTGGASTTQMGGLVGTNTGDLLNSYSNATYAGTSASKGGLVGSNSGTVENCYAAGIASGVSAFAGSNSGTIQNCYTNAVGSGYIGTDSNAPMGSGTYGAVQSSTKHLNYMYRDNLITKNTNSYVGTKDAIADGIDVYVDKHIPVWNGLVSALNQWVKEKNQVSDASSLYYNKDFTAWHRPLTTHINGDLPVLGFAKDNSLGTLDSDGKFLQYGSNQNGGNGLDAVLTTFNNSTASIFHYGKATGVANVPTSNVKVSIAEDAVLLQGDGAGAFTATVGVTFDNSDHGQHAFDFWGNRLLYDWHLLSTPLNGLMTGAVHSSYTAGSLPNSQVDITNIGGYFPDGLITNDNPAVGGTIKWDFYTYYEPEYHWINLKRSKNNHIHQDGGAPIHYDQNDQDTDGNSAYYIPGKGYEMAINQDTYMNATGTLNRGDVTITLTNSEPDDINYAKGWNLVGNPYQAYLDIDEIGYDPIYTYDADQGTFVPYTKTASVNPAIVSEFIHPHQAFFVHAATDGETLEFTQSMATTSSEAGSYFREKNNYPLVNLFADDDVGHRDLTVIEFHRPELGGAPKLDYMRTAPFNLAAHYAGTSYGILFATDDIERVPVKFKPSDNGLITLTWSTHNGEFRKLLLIDNKLGVEHNMLADNSYTFEASPDDYSSRFYIVYDCSGMGIEENEDDGGALTGSATFAYISHGNIVIDVGTSHGASLQIIDVLGRVLYSKTMAGTDGTYTVSTRGLAKGVYLIRLADGHNVKTQKLVVQ